MNKLPLTSLALCALLCTAGGAEAAKKGKSPRKVKVTICHVPPGNPDNAHTITIGFPAVAAHFRNHTGDHLGECVTTPDCQPTPTPTPSCTEKPICPEKPVCPEKPTCPCPDNNDPTFSEE